MENSRVVTIEELIQGGCPLTGTSSLRNCSTSSKSSFSKQPSKLSTPPASTNPNLKVLTPLHYPAIVIGTLTLPPAVHDGTSSFTLLVDAPTDYGTCFQFSDGSVTICCDILDLDLAIIGKKIRFIAWNFILIKGGAFLEIISWSFLDPDSGTCRRSNCGNNYKSRYSLHGFVYMGKEKPCLMYLIAERSDLRLRRFDKIPSANRRTLIKGKGECRTYIGVVRGLISVRNVHFVNPKFPWMKMLILGSCYKTSITIKLLLLASCFWKKFTGILSQKAILGSKDKEGLIQRIGYFLLDNQHGVFMALCKRDSCASSGDKYSGNLELNWKISHGDKLNSLLLCERNSYGHSIKKIFSIKVIGIILIGNLK
ncbi:hypothetical protein UlMin_034399, partial [Ulmus minor]